MPNYRKDSDAISRLSPEQYRVTQLAATERPGSGEWLTQIQRSLRGLRVLTQGLPRGPRGADESRAVAKPAGCDGNGS
jgi:hypothetical protein